MTASLAQALVDLAELTPGECVLDIGTGTGIVARAAARKVHLAGRVIGADLSEGMLQVARRQVNPNGVLQFHKMDAEQLDFEPARFDVVVSLFAILHFPHPERALREMFRVLRPRGRVVLGIGGSAPVSLAALGSLWTRFRESGNVLAAPKALDSFVAARFPQASEHETARDRKSKPLEQLLREAGFLNIQQHWRTCTHGIEKASDFWDLQVTFSSVVRKRLESLPRDEVEKLRTEFCSQCDTVLQKGGRLIYRNGATILSGSRP